MVEQTSIECKRMIRNDIIVLAVSIIAFAIGFMGEVADRTFSFALLQRGLTMGLVYAGAIGIFLTLFLAIASGGNYFWAFMGAGIGEMIALLLVNWVAGLITSNLTVKNTIIIIAICLFFVLLVVHLLSTRKEYKEAVERESAMQIHQNADENEWLIKQEVSQQEVSQQEVSQQAENEWLIK